MAACSAAPVLPFKQPMQPYLRSKCGHHVLNIRDREQISRCRVLADVGANYWLQDSSFAARLNLWHKHKVHKGCVNTVSWSDCGRYLLTGSDDRTLAITEAWTLSEEPVSKRITTAHRGNVFCAKFLPGTENGMVVSCAADGTICITDVNRPDTYGANVLNCHSGTTYELATLPFSSHTFFSCGEDCTVRWFDTREKLNCTECSADVCIQLRRSTCALAVQPSWPHRLAVAASDGLLRLYDVRKLNKGCSDTSGYPGLCSICTLPAWSQNAQQQTGALGRGKRITSVDFSPDNKHLLLSYSNDDVYVYECETFLPSTDKVDLTSVLDSGSGAMPRRIRLRGDWSDTGPRARPMQTQRQAPPERDTETHSDSSTPPPLIPDVDSNNSPDADADLEVHPGVQLMSRLSNMLTALLAERMNRRRGQTEGGGEQEEHGGGEETGAAGEQVGQNDETGGQSETLRSVESGYETAPSPTTLLLSSSMQHSAVPSEDTGLKQENVPAQGDDISAVPETVRNESDSEDEIWHTPREGGDEAVVEEPPKVTVSMEPASSPPATSHSHSADSSPDDNDNPPDDNSDPRLARMRRLKALLAKRVKQNSSDGEVSTLSMAQRLLIVLMQSLPQHKCIARLSGHRNARTILKEARFFGPAHIVSGSDCGHALMWHWRSGELVWAATADAHVVNCVQPHPYLFVLATSGIQYDVKLWQVSGESASCTKDYLSSLAERNKAMLEETRDTVTIPASFMLRMLAHLARQNRGEGDGDAEAEQQESDAARDEDE